MTSPAVKRPAARADTPPVTPLTSASASPVVDAAARSGDPVRLAAAVAVAGKMLDIQRDAGAAIVALLDPAVGSLLDRKA